MRKRRKRNATETGRRIIVDGPEAWHCGQGRRRREKELVMRVDACGGETPALLGDQRSDKLKPGLNVNLDIWQSFW